MFCNTHSAQCQSRNPNSSPRKKRKANSRSHVMVKKRSMLFQAALDSCMVCIHEAFRSGCDINTQDETGYTALMVAAEVGRMDIIELLINQNPDVTIRNQWGETALYLAVCQRGTEVTTVVHRLLLHNRSAVNIPSNAGCVPLFRLALRFQETSGTLTMIRDLINANANLDVKGSDPAVLQGRLMTPFEMATTVGNFRVCKLLYEAGCDVSVVHNWIRSNGFPKLLCLRSNWPWMDAMLSWAKEPMSLLLHCKIRICKTVRQNGYDVRHQARDLGLPDRLAMLLIDD